MLAAGGGDGRRYRPGHQRQRHHPCPATHIRARRAAVDHQHAIECSELRRHRLHGGEIQLGLAILLLQHLRRRGLETAVLQREELQVGDRRLGRERQADAVVLDRGAAAIERDRLRNQLTRGGKQRGEVRWSGTVTHRQRQLQVRAAGNAHIAADQPVSARSEVDRLSGGDTGRRRQAHRQQHFAFVAEVHQRPDRQSLRHRPFDGAGGPALRQCPLDLRGQARVAGHLPVGVPVQVVLDA
jgi:hypothetical protein